MATSIDLSAFKTFTINTESSGIMADITDLQFVVFLNQSLVNKYQELKHDAPATFSVAGTLTVSSSGFEATLPSDIDPDTTKSILIYDDINRRKGSELARSLWRRFGAVVRFNHSFASKVFQLEYQKEQTEYDSATMSTVVVETASVRGKNYLAYEIRRLFFDGLSNSEPSAAGQYMRINSQDIS